MGAAFTADGHFIENAPTDLDDENWDIQEEQGGEFNFAEDGQDWTPQAYTDDMPVDESQPFIDSRVAIRVYTDMRNMAMNTKARIINVQGHANYVGDGAMWGLLDAAQGVFTQIQRLAEGGIMHHAEEVARDGQ